jgi:hypothetical protein
MAYMDILPDPDRKIMNSGRQNNVSGTAGPGFASVKFSSNQPTMVSRTNGGKVVTRSQATQYWQINISYNPLTRDEFEPINSFLMSRQGRLSPFYVVLPQYSVSRDSTFATYAASNTISTVGVTNSGATKLTAQGFNSSDSPRPGDMFTIEDTENSNHVKAYMITRVETNADYPGGTQPTDTQRIINFNPPMIYSSATATTINFTAPKVRVISTKNVTDYSLGTNNLYQFNLSLEEALP